MRALRVSRRIAPHRTGGTDPREIARVTFGVTVGVQVSGGHNGWRHRVAGIVAQREFGSCNGATGGRLVTYRDADRTAKDVGKYLHEFRTGHSPAADRDVAVEPGGLKAVPCRIT